jgi:glutamyl-tRNA synthetase
VAGRFAPSPTGDLHLGNLRTALVAWLAARASGRRFLVRMEDLDRVTASVEHERRQLDDLAALGLDHDGEVVRQSERFDRYRDAIAALDAAGLVYPCYCTRREIRAEIDGAASAPHGLAPDGAYPGTCRELSASQRAQREADGRTPALRLRAGGVDMEVHDVVAGITRGVVDDVVLQRRDGVPAYNLAVVVDDAAQGVTQVVRGDDLLSSTPRQVLLQHLLGLPTPEYLHVPLVLGSDGTRLAKRHGAVTLADLAASGIGPESVLAALAVSLGVAADGETVTTAELVERFDPNGLPRRPVSLAELRRSLW